MNRITIFCSVAALFFVAVILSVPPVWSVPGDRKLEIQKPAAKGTKETGALKDGSKGKTSVKKTVAKKAGTAATVGVAGAKIKSGVKGKVSIDKE